MSYRASAWISTGTLAGGAEVWLAWYSASNATLKWDKIGSAASTSPWAQVSGTMTAPSGTATVRLVLRTVAGSGTAWFDDASLTTGSSSSVSGTGLTGQYFDNADFTMPKLTRTDPTVDFVWGLGSPSSLVGADTFSVRWTGQIEAPASGTYTFSTVSDDGVRLWVNGQLLVNNWTIHAATENSGTIFLSAGQKVAVRMEIYENGGDATARLLWSGPGIAKQVVPQSRLHPQ